MDFKEIMLARKHLKPGFQDLETGPLLTEPTDNNTHYYQGIANRLETALPSGHIAFASAIDQKTLYVFTKKSLLAYDLRGTLLRTYDFDFSQFDCRVALSSEAQAFAMVRNDNQGKELMVFSFNSEVKKPSFRKRYAHVLDLAFMCELLVVQFELGVDLWLFSSSPNDQPIKYGYICSTIVYEIPGRSLASLNGRLCVEPRNEVLWMVDKLDYATVPLVYQASMYLLTNLEIGCVRRFKFNLKTDLLKVEAASDLSCIVCLTADQKLTFIDAYEGEQLSTLNDRFKMLKVLDFTLTRSTNHLILTEPTITRAFALGDLLLASKLVVFSTTSHGVPWARLSHWEGTTQLVVVGNNNLFWMR